MNPHLNPRGEALNGVLRTHRRNEHRQRQLKFTDRAAGIVQDGYDETMIIEAVCFCWQGQRASAELHLRTTVDFLLLHNLLLRSEMRLSAKLPNFFTIQLPNEGPTPCHAMIMVMDNGKMNALGRLKYRAVMRHYNPFLYIISHTAFYLFCRWNIAGEAPPCFQRRQQWYNLHLRKGADALKRISCETQLDWINRMFTSASMASLKKTHAGRSQGAKHAELNGVNEGQIRRAG